MEAEIAQFSADLLQSVREMQANQRATTTHVTLSQITEAPPAYPAPIIAPHTAE